MARLTKIKTRPKDGATEIMVLVNHPMETGLRVDAKTKQKIPAHFIQNMVISLNGKNIANVDMGVAISKDPLVGVMANVKKGDKIKATWNDNKGETGTAEETAA